MKHFKSTIDDYMSQWSAALYSGRTEMAEDLLEAVKRHDRLGKSWEIRVAEAETFISEVGAIPSGRITHFWNEMKSDLETFPHECKPHPCSICSEKAALLTVGALSTETYQDAIHHTSQWIRLYEDDIMGRACHAVALKALGMELTQLSTDALDPAEAVEQPIQDSPPAEAVDCFTRALEALQVSTRLIQELPDDKVYFAKYIRPKAPDLYKQLEEAELTQDFDPLDIGTPKTEDLSDFDPIAIPADTFRGMLTKLTAQILLELNRPQEALPVLYEALKGARDSDDTEAIASLLFTLAQALLILNRYKEALPVLKEALKAYDSDNAEAIVLLRCLLSVTLMELNRHKEALPVLQEALQGARDLDNAEDIASLLYALSKTLLILNRHQEALPLLQEALQGARDSGDASEVNRLRVMLAQALLELDREEEAFPLMRESLEYEMRLPEIET